MGEGCASPRHGLAADGWLCASCGRERQEGPRGEKNGGKEGEEKERLGEDGEGQGCVGVRGKKKIFPSFFTDPPLPSPQSRFDFSHRSSQPPRMQMTFIMQMHANQV